jgi:hypothetical protein
MTYEPITPTWGSNFKRAPIETLSAMLSRREKTMQEKRAVMDAHKPGSAYHTRAQREYNTAKEQAEILRAMISERKDKTNGKINQ